MSNYASIRDALHAGCTVSELTADLEAAASRAGRLGELDGPPLSMADELHAGLVRSRALRADEAQPGVRHLFEQRNEP